jgi:hypothetical protein
MITAHRGTTQGLGKAKKHPDKATQLHVRRLCRYPVPNMFGVANNSGAGAVPVALVVPMLYEALGSDIVTGPEDVETLQDVDSRASEKSWQ